MTTQTLQINNNKTWAPYDDIKLLKNWNKPEKELGLMLGRTNVAITARRNFLRHDSNRIKELTRSFPQVTIPNIKEEKSTKMKKTSFTKFGIPKSIAEQFHVDQRQRIDSYTLRESLFVLNNPDMSLSILGKELNRFPSSLGVYRSFLNRYVKSNPDAPLLKLMESMKNYSGDEEMIYGEKYQNRVRRSKRNVVAVQPASPLVVSEQPIITPLPVNTPSKTISVGFNGMNIDWENKKIIFELAS